MDDGAAPFYHLLAGAASAALARRVLIRLGERLEPRLARLLRRTAQEGAPAAHPARGRAPLPRAPEDAERAPVPDRAAAARPADRLVPAPARRAAARCAGVGGRGVPPPLPGRGVGRAGGGVRGAEQSRSGELDFVPESGSAAPLGRTACLMFRRMTIFLWRGGLSRADNASSRFSGSPAVQSPLWHSSVRPSPPARIWRPSPSGALTAVGVVCLSLLTTPA